MADDQTFSTRLQTISKANINPIYEPDFGKSFRVLQGLARFVIALDPDKALPSSHRNNLNFSALEAPENASFSDYIDLAFFVTDGLFQMLPQLNSLPQDQQQATQFKPNVSRAMGRFVTAWGNLIPMLQAVAGNDMFAKTRELQRAAEDDAKAIHTLLDASQDAAKKIGAGKHAEAFKTLADEYKNKSNREFKLTVAIALIFIAAVVVTGKWTFSIPKDDYGRLVQVVIGKILGLGVLYFMLVLVARSYRANAHLAAVNLHRATSLQIFATFADSASDDQTKNAILLETTRSIYSHTPTGFLTGEDPSSPIQIVEILKALGPNKPG